MNSIGGSVCGGGGIVMGAMAMTQINTANEINVILSSGA